MPESGNAAQFEAWNGEHGLHWVAIADQRDRVLAPVAEVLLTAAAPSPGMRVLDVGCGCGVTTLRVAGIVGDAGSVTGVDISEPMLGVARDRAGPTGPRTNVSLVRADAQTHSFRPRSVDLVISRFGTMFFSDPVAAFTNIATSLVGGGRLCIATWQRLASNEWIRLPIETLVSYGAAAPPLEGSGMFAQSDPATVTSTLSAAGFGSVTLDAVDITFDVGSSIDEAMAYVIDSGAVRTQLEAIPESSARDAALADLRHRLEVHHDGAGVKLGGSIWLIRAAH
jgi:SAM-dependent methyltransferase